VCEHLIVPSVRSGDVAGAEWSNVGGFGVLLACEGTCKSEWGGRQMEKVAGIGGLFFRAHDPKALANWYLQHLGIALEPTREGGTVWQQEAGPTVFSPFPEKTDYFGDPAKVWMVNFRVHDLDKMVAQLRTAGIEVKDPESYPNIGRFARLHDPEGNPIELWQPS
jgi:glyoxylase I family protein